MDLASRLRGFSSPTCHRCAGRILKRSLTFPTVWTGARSWLLALVLASLAAAVIDIRPSFAAACAAASPTTSDRAAQHLFTTSNGQCSAALTPSGSGDTVVLNNGLVVTGPRQDDVGAPVNNDDFVNIYAYDGSTPVPVNVTSTCPAAWINITNPTGTRALVELPVGDSVCPITVTFEIGGQTITYQGLIRQETGIGATRYFLEAATITITQTIANEPDPDFVRERTQRVISNFMSRRGDQITANDPDLTHRLNGNANGNGGAVNFTGEGTLGQTQMAFSTSLRQIVGAGEAARRNRAAELGGLMALGQTGLKDAIPAPDEEGFDLWVEGKWAHVDDETRDSELGLLYVGFDYRFNRDLALGILTQFDWTDETDSLVGAKADGFGWMVGPYVVARLMSQLIFDGRVTFGQSDNDVNPFGTYTDSFDGNRWLIRGQLTGELEHAGIAIAPHVRVIYYEERQESYVDSLGILIPGQTVSLGRLTFGPKVSGHHEMSDGTVVAPHLAFTGIWDFDEAEIVNVVTGLAAGSSDELRGKVEGGLAVQFAGGWRLDGKGFYDGIGADDLDVYGGSVTCTVPLN